MVVMAVNSSSSYQLGHCVNFVSWVQTGINYHLNSPSNGSVTADVYGRASFAISIVAPLVDGYTTNVSQSVTVVYN